jgi:hypothetical protein
VIHSYVVILFNSIYLCAKLNSPEASYKVSTGKKMGRVRRKKASENSNIVIKIIIIIIIIIIIGSSEITLEKTTLIYANAKITLFTNLYLLHCSKQN